MKKNRLPILLIVIIFAVGMAAMALGAARAARPEAEPNPAPLEFQPPAVPVNFDQPQASPQSTYMYTSTSAPQTIPDCSLFPLEDILLVPQNFTILDLNIGLLVSHPDRRDLSIALVSPEAQVVTLAELLPGEMVPNLNVLFDQEMGLYPDIIPHDLLPPYYRTVWTPLDELATAFYGHPSGGAWKLQICDNNLSAGTGNLLQWSLWFDGQTSGPDFGLSHFVAPAKVAWGQPIPTRIVVKNTGTTATSTAEMVNNLPANVAFDEASLVCPNGTCYYSLALHALHWTGSLGTNETAEISYNLIPLTPGSGPYTNIATITDGTLPDVVIQTIAYDAPVIIEQHTFEMPDPQFYTYTTPNDWYWGNGMGDKPFHTGPLHWMTAPSGMSNYTSGVESMLNYDLDLSAYPPGSPIALQWWEWHDFDADLDDYAVLKVEDTPVYTINASDLTWSHRQVDLSPFAGQVVRLTWTLFSQPDGDTGMGWHIDEVSVHTTLPGADLALLLTDWPDPVLSDNLVTYTAQVSNNGVLSATNVVITSLIPANTGFNGSNPPGVCTETGTHVICSLPDLAPLESAQVEMAFWVSQLYEGWLTNTVEVAADQFDPLPLNNQATELTYASISMMVADMSVTLHDTYDPIMVGSYQTYTVNVVNSGFITATSVIAKVNLPTGISFSHSVPAICIQVGPDINCTFGQVPPGGNAHVDFLALVEAFVAPGILTATAEVTTTVTDPLPLNNYTVETTLALEAPTQADLALNMLGSPAALPAQGLLTYTLNVQNAGPLSATNVSIVDTLPVNVIYLRSIPNICALVDNLHLECPIGMLEEGTFTDVQVLVQVKPNASLGLFQNNAQVTADQPDPNPLNNQDNVWTTVTAGDETRPLIYSVTPEFGLNTGSTAILINGINFSDSTVVYLGSLALTQTLALNAGQIQAILPPGLPPGTYDLRTLNTDLQVGRLANAFTVLEDTLFNITSIRPKLGLVDGPVMLNIYGENFSPDLVGWASNNITTVVALESLQFIDIHQIRAVIPAGIPAGIYDVILESPSLGQYATLIDAYAAFDPATYDDLTTFDYNLWLNPPAPVIGANVTAGLVVHRFGGTEVLTEVTVGFGIDGVLLGYDTITLDPLRSREVATITWPVPVTPGLYNLQAYIDPFDSIPEADETNNLITRTVRVLSPPSGTPPTIQSFTITSTGGGLYETNTRQVTLDVTASGDPAWLFFAEFVFNQNASAWLPVAQSGWLPYAEASGGYDWLLEPLPGAHYIQVWAATDSGSVSLPDPLASRRLMNFMPDQTPIARDQGHIYRSPIPAGQTMVVRLISLEGDADLYVFRPNGTLIARSETGDEVETIVFTTSSLGIYQVEVLGYTNARYRLEVYKVSGGTLLLEETITSRQPDRGRDRPFTVLPPSDELGLPNPPIGLYTTLLPTVQR